jgi:hypothetical protein
MKVIWNTQEKTLQHEVNLKKNSKQKRSCALVSSNNGGTNEFK